MEEEATADQSSFIAERILNSHASSVSSSAGSSDDNEEETTAPNATTSNSHPRSNNDTDEEEHSHQTSTQRSTAGSTTTEDNSAQDRRASASLFDLLTQRTKKSGNDYISLILAVMWRAALLMMGAIFFFLVATAAYVLLYWLLIPAHTHRSDIFFDYGARGPVYDLPTKGQYASRNRLSWPPHYHEEYERSSHREDDTGSNQFHEEITKDILPQSKHRRRRHLQNEPNARKWGPIATVDLFAKHGQWNDFQRSGIPSAAEACSELQVSGFAASDIDSRMYSTAPLPACSKIGECPLVESAVGLRTSAPSSKRSVLTRDMEYSISLDVALPASEVNRKASTFMVRVDLHSDPDTELLRRRQQVYDAAVKKFDKLTKELEHRQEQQQQQQSPPCEAPVGSEGNSTSAAGTCFLPSTESILPRLEPPREPGVPCMVLASSLRPVVVPWVPPIVKATEALAWAPYVALSPLFWWLNGGPVAVGSGASGVATPSAMAGTHKVHLELFDRFKESRAQPLSAITITLSDETVEIYGATLTVTARLRGLRYYMYHWFWVSAIVGIGSIIVGEVIIVAAVYVFFILTAPPSEGGERAELGDGEIHGGATDGEGGSDGEPDLNDGSSSTSRSSAADSEEPSRRRNVSTGASTIDEGTNEERTGH